MGHTGMGRGFIPAGSGLFQIVQDRFCLGDKGEKGLQLFTGIIGTFRAGGVSFGMGTAPVRALETMGKEL